MGNSVFLQQTGHAIFSSIWQGAVLYLALSALLVVCKGNAILKYRLAQGFQFILLALFAFNCFGINSSPADYNSFIAPDVYMPVSWKAVFDMVIPYSGVLYFLILGVQCIRFIDAYLFTRDLAAKGLHKIPYPYRLFTSEMSMHLSVKKKVQIFLSDRVTTPLTIGFLKPLILIPFACINQLSPAQLEAIILHELSHIKRADYLLQVLQVITEKILFFNPFIKIISRIIDEEREMACDNMVLQFRCLPEDYAGALLAIARTMPAQNIMALHASGKKDQVLLKRIQKILQVSGHSNYTQHIKHTALSMVAVVLFTFIRFNASEQKLFIAEVGTNPVFAGVLTNKARPAQPAPAVSEPVKRSNYFYKPAPVASKNKIRSIAADNSVKAESKKNIQAGIIKPAAAEISKADTKENTDELAALSDEDMASVIPPQMLQNVSGNKIVLTPDMYNQLLSYYNFKRMQYTIASVPDDSISITESDQTQSSFRKLITVEATDSNGDVKSFDIIVELYQ